MFGTPGADTQPQAQLQFFLNRVAFGMPLQKESKRVVLAAVFGAFHAFAPGHGINDPSFLQPDRPMSAIGG